MPQPRPNGPGWGIAVRPPEAGHLVRSASDRLGKAVEGRARSRYVAGACLKGRPAGS